ncbi:CRISPR-associated endonuclease Cas2 [Heliobacillus mobilis]|uniref:CRISPR-associated endoribonuclease Cas2 n=1 Tax=Heliobacterium mobile TaxID=28064 RepID=A0A6I3SQK7_HELMO|nr:CRISPR-associated endonuclease Cas2 [Heliobacterium mobile]MTV50975.1 CRISPR-associated endonuclease Cas2 [Heliobacterium mobile]
MRRCYLVCYDISDAKRLRKVFKTMKGYGEHWQYSIFFCVLKDIERVRLQGKLESIVNAREDQIMIVDLGSNEEKARESTEVIGKRLEQIDERLLVF